MRPDLTNRAGPGFASAAAEFRDYLANPGHFRDPYPLFKRIRDVEPLHWSKSCTWVVLGQPEAREVFKNPALSRQASAEEFVGRYKPDTTAARVALDTFLAQFVNMDDPDHTRVRALVAHAFTPKAVRKWDGVIHEAIAELVTVLEEREEFDVLHDFGYPIPSRVICDMVGVPRVDHKLFEHWTTAWLNTNLTDPGQTCRGR